MSISLMDVIYGCYTPTGPAWPMKNVIFENLSISFSVWFILWILLIFAPLR